MQKGMMEKMEKMEKDVEMAKLKESIAVYIFVQQKWDENKGIMKQK